MFYHFLVFLAMNVIFPCNPKNVLFLCIMCASCDEIYLEILASIAYTRASALFLCWHIRFFFLFGGMKIENLRRHKLKLVQNGTEKGLERNDSAVDDGVMVGAAGFGRPYQS